MQRQDEWQNCLEAKQLQYNLRHFDFRHLQMSSSLALLFPPSLPEVWSFWEESCVEGRLAMTRHEVSWQFLSPSNVSAMFDRIGVASEKNEASFSMEDCRRYRGYIAGVGAQNMQSDGCWWSPSGAGVMQRWNSDLNRSRAAEHSAGWLTVASHNGLQRNCKISARPNLDANIE